MREGRSGASLVFAFSRQPLELVFVFSEEINRVSVNQITKLQMTKYYKLHCKFLGSILTDSFTEREQCRILFPTFSTVGAI